ncbi:MAG: hypothetical protein V2B18_18445 [Pseudomonadota bacterium]
MIETRYYHVHGSRWEARFFRKGESFPDCQCAATRQGVWGKPVRRGWESARFLADSWRMVEFEPDIVYLSRSDG